MRKHELQTGYTKTFETQILRTKHTIAFNESFTAHSVMQAMAEVPLDATVDDCGVDDDSGLFYIEFHHEKAAQ